MKKLILTSLLTLALAASASAAVPAGGVYLDKDGTPLTEAQQVPPSLRSHKMAPQNAAIQEAMAALPHSTSTLIALTVTEDGTAANASVAQSSGSIILDQYAIDSVNLWQFRPAKRGDRSVSTSVTIPLRFISTMISVPAAPTSQVLKDMPEEVREAAERNAHPVLTVKVVENSQRDINIAFMNEVAMICDRMGIDTDEVLAGMNTKWNALGFKPGLVGGHCIGVDPYYLTNAAEALGYHSQIILNGRKVNDSMGGFVADAAIKQMIEAGMAPKKATVVILGITFKENCPDTRNSKVVDIINRLKEYDIHPVVTDPWADAAVAQHEYGVTLTDFDKIPKADCVIVAVGHNEFRSLSMMQLKELFKKDLPDSEKVLIDVKSLYRMDELKASGIRFWRL